MKLYAVIGTGWNGDDEDVLDFTLPKGFFTTRAKAKKIADRFNNKDLGNDDWHGGHNYLVYEFIVDEERKNANVRDSRSSRAA